MSANRWSREVKGWLAGCGVVAASICAFVLVISAVEGGLIGLLGGVVVLLPVALLTMAITCVLTIIPAALVIWFSERFETRSRLFFGCAGATIGALTQTQLFQTFAAFSWLFVVGGCLAGIVYWYVAGRHANRDGSCAPQTSAE